MTILIFEDEIHNFKYLLHMLEELLPGSNIIGPVYSVSQGKDTLANPNTCHDIDIIIADIQLNDGLSFDALRYAPDDVPIIFTTAYDEHALRAFEFNSLSYLLKPIDEDELAIAIQKAKRLKGKEQGHAGLLPRLASQDVYRERFIVKTSKGERIIPIYNIRYIVSEQKTTYLKLLDNTSYPIEMTLDAVSQQLDPQRFMRVNRKYVIPLQQVAGKERIENGKELLHLKGEAAPEIIISRDRKKIVTEWLEG